MSYLIKLSQKAEDDLRFHKKSGNNSIVNKIKSLLGEIAFHPFEGTGKPEQLKHKLSGIWSRRINQEHRLIYEVQDDSILIHSVKGHYA